MYGEGDYFMIAGLKAVAWDELNNLLFHSDQLELDFPEVVKEVYSSRGSHEELKSLLLTRILDYSDELYGVPQGGSRTPQGGPQLLPRVVLGDYQAAQGQKDIFVPLRRHLSPLTARDSSKEEEEERERERERLR